MKNAETFSEILKQIRVSPVLKSKFSLEQLTKYEVINRRLNEAHSGSTFRIVFCGVFSSGKTSLINSLLAFNELKLPVGINPITKIITRIRYGCNLSCSYVSGGRQYFISPQEMEQAVQGKKQIYADNSEIIITVPSEFLKGNVEILDTPGFYDEAGELERISKAAIAEADMAVLCCNALMLGEMIEKDLLQELENITGHFSLVITRIDNINDMNDYEDMMRKAVRLMKGKKDFVFPVVAAGMYQHVDDFRKYLSSIISDKNLMLKIHEEAVRKSSTLYIDEIRAVTDNTLSELRASLIDTENINNRIIRTKELDAKMEMSRFENMKNLALDAAAAFTAQGAASLRAAIIRAAINSMNNPYTFQNNAKKLSDQTIEQIISELADYARSKSIKGYESIAYNLLQGFRAYSYSMPALSLSSVSTVSEVYEPAMNIFWSEPVAWLAGQWNKYLDASGAGIRTSGFTGGHEQEIKRIENSIAQCEDVRSLFA